MGSTGYEFQSNGFEENGRIMGKGEKKKKRAGSGIYANSSLLFSNYFITNNKEKKGLLCQLCLSFRQLGFVRVMYS